MFSELIAFRDAFNCFETLVAEVIQVYNKHIPVQLFKDFNRIFDVILKGSGAFGNRFMLYISAEREECKDKIISDIRLVRSSQNLEDGLPKAISQASLNDAVSTGSLTLYLRNV